MATSVGLAYLRSDSRAVTALDEEISRLNASLPNAAKSDPTEFEKLVRRLETLQTDKRRLVSGEDQAPRLPTRVASAATLGTQRTARPARRLEPARDGFIPATWGENFRGFPNDLIRTGLFNVRRSEPRAQLSNELIATYSNTMMLYSGEELRIKDEDVLMQIFHFQQRFMLGIAWEANGRDFLKSMHWTDGQRGYNELYDSLLRLSKGHLTLMRRNEKGEAESFVLEAGALLSELKVEHGGRAGPSRITISVNPKTEMLWKSMGYTLVNWEQRLTLNGSLSRYLHRYYSSHQEPYPLKVATLRTLTGSTASTKGKFVQLLKDALQSLVDIDFLAAYWIDKADLVHVNRVRVMIGAAD
jgi:hypothetical protein